jgi:large subunit ribosomal protein L30
MDSGSKCFIVIRLRGNVNNSEEVNYTLKLLHITRVNHAVLMDNRSSYLGMINKVKDLITWGEVSKENVLNLVKKRGRLTGGRKLDNTTIKELGYDSLESLSEDLYNLKRETLSIPNMKPMFRLTPPTGGLTKKKRSVGDTGSLGYRGEAINELLTRMI